MDDCRIRGIEDPVVRGISCDEVGNLIVNTTDNTDYTICLNKEAVRDSIEDDLNNLKEEYENKLQRKTVHIGRGNQLTGRRIHGRGRKVAIRKGSFRNKERIIGEPTGA